MHDSKLIFKFISISIQFQTFLPFHLSYVLVTHIISTIYYAFLHPRFFFLCLVLSFTPPPCPHQSLPTEPPRFFKVKLKRNQFPKTFPPKHSSEPHPPLQYLSIESNSLFSSTNDGIFILNSLLPLGRIKKRKYVYCIKWKHITLKKKSSGHSSISCSWITKMDTLEEQRNSPDRKKQNKTKKLLLCFRIY